MYAAAFLLLSVPVSCTKDIHEEPEPEDPSSLVIDQKEVTIPAEGGEGKATYTLDNPKDDLRLEAACTAEWITALDTETEGQITFIADANTTYETRETEVTVKYGEDVTGSFKIIQEGAEKPADFVINIEETTLSSITYGITPLNNDLPYANMILRKSVFDEFKSEEEIFKNDINAIKDYIKTIGLSLEEYLNTYLLTGPSTGITKRRITPSTEFVVYAYGMDYTGTPTTGITKKETCTRDIEMSDITFEISASSDDISATVSYKPSDENQYYLAGIVSKKEYDNSEDYFNTALLSLRQSLYYYEDVGGLSYEDAIAAVFRNFCKKGNCDETFEIHAATEYIAYAVSVNDEIFFSSEPSTTQFTTADASMSDNVITLSVSDIETRIANYSITTTNNDPYAFITLKSEEFKSLSDEEILEKLFATYNFDSSTLTGSKSGRLTNLEPETEYYMLAFGYQSGKATTQLFKEVFTTTEIKQSDVTFSLVLDKYFSGADFQEMYPNRYNGDISHLAVVPTMVEVSPRERFQRCYYAIYEGDYTSTSTLSDDAAIEEITARGSSWQKNEMLLKYNMEFTIIGVSVDIAGNYGKVWRHKLCLTEDGASPIEEYEEYNNSLNPWATAPDNQR